MHYVFRLIDFPEFAINHESQWEFQLIISEILGHHNQGWTRNLQLRDFQLVGQKELGV